MSHSKSQTDYESVEWQALGTTCRMLFCGSIGSGQKEFSTHIISWLAEFERKYSRFNPESIISQINRNAGKTAVPVDSELADILKLCDWFHWSTGGIFDPTMAPLTALWEEAKQAVTKAAAEKALEQVNWKRVEHDEESVFLPEPGMALDLGGIGKEYAVDRTVQMALEQGMVDIMVNFGKDVRTNGQPPEGGAWKIGLEDPNVPSACWCGVGFANDAIASSGNYARKRLIDGHEYGHILDPRSGYPAENDCLAVSVIAPSCTEAGILSTAAFILGREAGLSLINRSHQAAGCIFSHDGQYRSRAFDRFILTRKTDKAKRQEAVKV